MISVCFNLPIHNSVNSDMVKSISYPLLIENKYIAVILTRNTQQCQSDSSSESLARMTDLLDFSLEVVLLAIALKNMDLNFLLGGVPGTLS